MTKRRISTIILFIVFFVGLLVIAYPTISDWWNSRVQTKAVDAYETAAAALSEDEYEEIFEKADEYNRALLGIVAPLVNYTQVEGYDDTLDITGTGVMGYLTIEKLDIELPIYHGTSNEVLTVAVGHLEGSSLPVGGAGTHCVISGHRGLPSAKLFTDLDELEEGDTFTITVLDRLLTYEVDQIRIVEPTDTENLNIDSTSDYVTLLTCTPYGVNSHRLLVRGHRIENISDSDAELTNEAFELDSTMLAPLVAIPLFLIVFALLFARDRKKK